MPNSFFRMETRMSQPMRINNIELRIHSQLIQLRLPIANGGMIWNRPVAVVVRTLHGQKHVLPIPDLTRMVDLILAGLCCGSVFFLIFFRRKKFESERKLD